MALSRKQRHLANLIVKIGRQRGATRKEIVSALETGWVEARFSNPRGGSGTSVGWRQETASSYPGVNRRNLRKSINRYYNETRRAGRGRGKTAGQLAQSVQRSAYPGRYDASRGLALRLYRHSPRGGGAGGGGGGGSGGRSGVPGMSSSSRTVTIGGHQIPEGSTGLATLLAAQLSQAQSQPTLSAPPAPSFSARNRLALPQGYGTPIENPPPPLSESKLADQLKQIQGLVGPTIQHPAVSVATANARTAGIAGTRGGGVTHDKRGIPRGTRRLHGVSRFDGKPVARWIIPWLRYARRHGWKGTVVSGYRSYAEQARIYNSGVRPAARPGRSNHQGKSFPRGAVDVTNSAQLSRILRRAGAPLRWAGGKDPPHFSHPRNGSY